MDEVERRTDGIVAELATLSLADVTNQYAPEDPGSELRVRRLRDYLASRWTARFFSWAKLLDTAAPVSRVSPSRASDR